MKLLNIGYYRDGGSFGLTTDSGSYWVDYSIGSQTRGEIYAGDINDKHPRLANIFERERVIEMLCRIALDKFDDERLKK